MGKLRAVRKSLLALGLLAGSPLAGACAQGLILGGAGASHRSIGGASTAVGVDALGALYWNPATTSGLPGSEVVLGGELLLPDAHVRSTIPAGAFGPSRPPVSLSRFSRSDSGVAFCPGWASCSARTTPA
jgi:hypothetical protein